MALACAASVAAFLDIKPFGDRKAFIGIYFFKLWALVYELLFVEKQYNNILNNKYSVVKKHG